MWSIITKKLGFAVGDKSCGKQPDKIFSLFDMKLAKKRAHNCKYILIGVCGKNYPRNLDLLLEIKLLENSMSTCAVAPNWPQITLRKSRFASNWPVLLGS